MRASELKTLAVVAALACAVVSSYAVVAPSVAFGQSAGVVTAADGVPGLKSGDFTLRPYVKVEGRYDSNIFNGSTRLDTFTSKQLETVVGAPLVRIQPGLTLFNGTSTDVAVTFDAFGDVRLYISDNPNVTTQNSVSGKANLAVQIAPRRTFSLTLSDYFTRDVRPLDFELDAVYIRLNNEVGAQVAFHPGPVPERRPFEMSLGYGFLVDRISGNLNNISLDSDTHRASFLTLWKFLPKTAAFLDANLRFHRYTSPKTRESATHADSNPMRVSAGLQGAITKKVAARAQVGYGRSFHKSADEYNMAIGQAAVTLLPASGTALSLGWQLDFDDSFFANFRSYNRIFTMVRHRIGTLIDFQVDASVYFARYGAFNLAATGLAPSAAMGGGAWGVSQKYRQETTIVGTAMADFNVSRFLGVYLGYELRANLTDYSVYQSLDNKRHYTDFGDYTRHQVFVGAKLRY